MDQSQYSQDFIDQLNNNTKKSKFKFNKLGRLQLIIIGLAILTAIVLIAGAAFSQGRPNLRRSLAQIVSQAESTNQLTVAYHKRLTSTQLREINTTLQATLTNLASKTNTYLQQNSDKKNKLVPAKVNLDNVKKQLDEAILNENLDRKFNSEIRYQIDQILLSLRQANRSTDNPEIKDMLSKNYDDLILIQTRLKNIN